MKHYYVRPPRVMWAQIRANVWCLWSLFVHRQVLRITEYTSVRRIRYTPLALDFRVLKVVTTDGRVFFQDASDQATYQVAKLDQFFHAPTWVQRNACPPTQQSYRRTTT
jgi:hypothetical protein